MTLQPYPDVIPRDEWPGPVSRFLPPPHTQGTQKKRCVCEAVTAAMEWTWARQGNPPALLDAVELFSRIEDVAQGGTQVGDVFEAIRKDGVKPLSGGGRYFAEWWDCATGRRAATRASFDMAHTAVSRGSAVVIPMPWYTGNRVGPDGWMLLGPTFLDPDAHCVFGYAPAARLVNGRNEHGIWCVQSQGSFSPKTQQRVVISEAQLKTAAFYACKLVTYSE